MTTMNKPERYAIYHGTELIGFSAFEHADPSMGMRMGSFYPEQAYRTLEPLYSGFSLVSFEESQAASEPEKLLAIQARRRELQEQMAAIVLHVETMDGILVPTVGIHIVDFYAELGEREITIAITDSSTYERFFDDPL